MKQLIATFISLQLMISPLAMAQNNQSNQASPEASIKAATATADVGKNAKYDNQSQIKNGGYDFYAKQALAVGTSIVGANIIGQCITGLKVASIATFMAGSLTHMASEFAGAKAQNENHNKRMDELKKVREEMIREGGQIQREILIRAKLEEEQTRDYIEGRIKWMTAVSAIYLAAMGLAINEEVVGHALGVSAAAPICSALTVGAAACVVGAPSGAVSTLPNFANPGAVVAAEGTCGALGAGAPACLAYLNTYLAVGWGACVPFSPASGLKGVLMTKALVGAYSMGIANTGNSNMSSYTVMLSGLLMLLVPSLQSVVSAAYTFPIPRSVTFGAAAALATTVTAGLKTRKENAEKNIADLDKLLKDFRENTDDPNGVDLGPSVANGSMAGPGSEVKPTDKKYDITKLETVTKTPVKTCLTDLGTSFEYSENGCKKPIIIAKPQFNIKDGVKVFNEVGTLANDMANSANRGDMAKANLIASQIGSQAAAIKDATKAIQDKLNKQLKASGKKPIDFDKEIKDKLDSMDSSFNQVAASQGAGSTSSSNSTDSSTNSAAIVSENKVDDANANQNSDSSSTNQGNQSADVNLINFGGESISSESVSESGTGENSGSKKIASLDDNSELAKANRKDISDDLDTSLFKQVSNRYFLNYDKIFKRKEISPPLATQDK